MVVLPPSCPPTELRAYATTPLDSVTRASVQKDFDTGAFARFRDPSVALTIYDEPTFYNLSHLRIRETLDTRNFTEAFAVIDGNAASSHALWWVTTTEESLYWTDIYTEEAHSPPVSYPGEAFVLWQLHVLTQDLPLQWINWDVGNIDVPEDIGDTFPYDSHAPQEPPYTLGLNFSRKADSQGFYSGAYITANYSETIWSDDPELRRRFLPQPSWVVRLTAAAAQGAGLISSWTASFGPRPGPGDIVKLQQQYDWDSPKWAWNGTTVSQISRGYPSRASRRSGLSSQAFGSCSRMAVANVITEVRRLQHRPIPQF